VARQLGI